MLVRNLLWIGCDLMKPRYPDKTRQSSILAIAFRAVGILPNPSILLTCRRCPFPVCGTSVLGCARKMSRRRSLHRPFMGTGAVAPTLAQRPGRTQVSCPVRGLLPNHGQSVAPRIPIPAACQAYG